LFCFKLSRLQRSIESSSGSYELLLFSDFFFLLLIQFILSFCSFQILSFLNFIVNKLVKLMIVLDFKVLLIHSVVLVSLYFPLYVLLQIDSFGVFPGRFEMVDSLESKINLVLVELPILAHGVQANNELPSDGGEWIVLSIGPLPLFRHVVLSGFSPFPADLLLRLFELLPRFIGLCIGLVDIEVVLCGFVECVFGQTGLVLQSDGQVRP